jgi:4-hydroxy-3-methylbut-2-enyl diphosphate reductase
MTSSEKTPTGSENKPILDVMLCSPRGFCAGVVRAIETVERALAL